MSRRRLLRHGWRAPAVGLPMASVLGLTALPAPAQDAATSSGSGRTLAIVPTLSVVETFTDNRFLAAGDRQSSLITQASPGVRVSARSGKVQGDLDYSLNGYAYTRGSGGNDLQNSLNGRLHAEAVENWAFIDASATINQQSISALGTQAPDLSLQNANQSEVATYSVSPSLRGSFAGLADYDARASYQVVRSDGFDAANARTNTASFRLRADPSNAGRLGWGATAQHEGNAYATTRSTASNRAEGTLIYATSPELNFTASAGRESSNLVSLDKETATTWGAGFDWHPSERTKVGFTREKRSFGNSHSGVVEFRTPRTVWRYIDTESLATSASTSIGSTQTAYDLLFTQLASFYPDPALRAQMVDAALARSGIGRGTLVNGGFLSAAPSVQRRQEASVAFNGLRTTTIITVFQTRTAQVDPLTRAPDDLSTQGTIRQRGVGATLSHRLTPESSANLSLTLLSSSAAATSLATRQRSVTLGWTTRLGPHTNLSLSARHVAFSSSTEPYRESALIAGLGFEF